MFQIFKFLSTLASAATLVATSSAGADGPDTTSKVGTLKVMSFNIRFDNPGDGENAWPKRAADVSTFLENEAPDIVGLQEALHHQIEQILKAAPGLASTGVGRDDGKTSGEYSAILYRRDRLTIGESGTFWLSDSPGDPGSKSWGNEIPRICSWAKFTEKESGRRFYVFNAHFDHRSQPSREKSAAFILERIGQRADPGAPVILTGDFNADEKNAAILVLKKKLTDTFRARRPDAADVGTFHGFTGKYGDRKIDYVFVGDGVTTVDATIHRDRPGDGRFLSDHEPVSATVRLGGD